jgi:LmbE family N-acetylglucosaminyl deacetylase
VSVHPRVQVVVAHPDDETFGCGSVLLHATAAGAVTAVCCATRGEAGGTGSDLGVVREAELRAAAAVLGVGRLDLLGYRDSGMNGPAAEQTLAGAPFERVVAGVRAAMAAFEPDVVVTLDASDGHRDHARIRDAAVRAASELGVPRVYLHGLPRSLIQRWVAHLRLARPDVEHLEGDTTTLGTPDEEITTVLDGRAHLPTRERAMVLHASQSSPFDGLPADLRAVFLATDHLRRIAPPWTGGERETSLFG